LIFGYQLDGPKWLQETPNKKAMVFSPKNQRKIFFLYRYAPILELVRVQREFLKFYVRLILPRKTEFFKIALACFCRSD
jgi:hypothetical protein